jgi:hypothetical protein
VTGKRVNLEVNTMDFGAALLGDVEYFLDHAAEHKATAISLIRNSNWPSPTWILVTIYYWTFFNALAITRLLRRSIWHLDSGALQDICQGMTGTAGIGGGAFIFETKPPVSANSRIMVLAKSQHRLHEAVWLAFFDLLKLARDSAALPRENAAEYALYQSLLDTQAQLGHDWLSELRNAVNYKTGVAYDAIRGTDRLAFRSVVYPPSSSDLQEMVLRQHQALISIGRPRAAVSDTPSVYALLMLCTCFVVDALAQDLHADILDRQSLSPQWRQARLRYLTRHGVTHQGLAWPIANIG